MFNLSEAEVVIWILLVLLNRYDDLHPSFKYKIVRKEIIRHNSETIVKYEPK